MDRSGRTRWLVLSGVFVALGVLIPLLFHSLGNAGAVFLPMHWPVFLAAALLPPGWAGAVGLLAPLLSGLLTGMPAFPFGLVLMAEMGTYGWVFGSWTVRSPVRSWGKRVLQLAGAMAAGRLIRLLVSIPVFVLLMDVPFHGPAVLGAMVLTGLPGIVLQLAVLPVVLGRLNPPAGTGWD